MHAMINMEYRCFDLAKIRRMETGCGGAGKDAFSACCLVAVSLSKTSTDSSHYLVCLELVSNKDWRARKVQKRKGKGWIFVGVCLVITKYWYPLSPQAV